MEMLGESIWTVKIERDWKVIEQTPDFIYVRNMILGLEEDIGIKLQ